jgi:hypothetical protein
LDIGGTVELSFPVVVPFILGGSFFFWRAFGFFPITARKRTGKFLDFSDISKIKYLEGSHTINKLSR